MFWGNIDHFSLIESWMYRMDVSRRVYTFDLILSFLVSHPLCIPLNIVYNFLYKLFYLKMDFVWAVDQSGVSPPDVIVKVDLFNYLLFIYSFNLLRLMKSQLDLSRPTSASQNLPTFQSIAKQPLSREKMWKWIGF